MKKSLSVLYCDADFLLFLVCFLTYIEDIRPSNYVHVQTVQVVITFLYFVQSLIQFQACLSFKVCLFI
jgi:hypothetical protein